MSSIQTNAGKRFDYFVSLDEDQLGNIKKGLLTLTGGEVGPIEQVALAKIQAQAVVEIQNNPKRERLKETKNPINCWKSMTGEEKAQIVGISFLLIACIAMFAISMSKASAISSGIRKGHLHATRSLASRFNMYKFGAFTGLVGTLGCSILLKITLKEWKEDTKKNRTKNFNRTIRHLETNHLFNIWNTLINSDMKDKIPEFYREDTVNFVQAMQPQGD